MTDLSRQSRRKPRRADAAVSPTRFRWSGLTVGLCLLGLLLACLVIFQALLQTGILRPTTTTQLTKAWGLLAAPAEQGARAKAAQLAKAALDQDPLQSSALSLLAAIEEQAGHSEKAATLMEAAARQSRRNDVADYYLFFHYMDERKYEQAVLHADGLLRRKFVSIGPSIYPRLMLGFSDPALVDALASRLAENPEWRAYFLDFANQKFREPNAIYPIYNALQKTGSPPTTAELAPYLNRLLQDKQYEKAYVSWVVFMPQGNATRLTNIYDGSFEGWPETPPFGWRLGDGARGSIEPADAYGRTGKALMVDFDGMHEPKLPSQQLTLSPGPYRLSGLVLTATPESAGRMAWTLRCDDQLLLSAPPAPNTKQSWVKFSANFNVPDTCKGQILELKPIPTDRRSTVEIWYDDLVIERISSDG